MTLCKYCKDQGFTLQQYENMKENIKQIAEEIRATLKYNGGMYYDTKDLFKGCDFVLDADIKQFIIQELKKLNIEFFDNNKLYRVAE